MEDRLPLKIRGGARQHKHWQVDYVQRRSNCFSPVSNPDVQGRRDGMIAHVRRIMASCTRSLEAWIQCRQLIQSRNSADFDWLVIEYLRALRDQLPLCNVLG